MNIKTSSGRVFQPVYHELSSKNIRLAHAGSAHLPVLKADQVKFGAFIHKNHGIHLPFATTFSLADSAQLQRAMLLKSLEKQATGDKSHLQVYLDSSGGASPTAAGPLAMADAFRLVDTPVDVVIRTSGSVQALWPYLNSSGSKIMYDRARLKLGPVIGAYNGKAKDANLKVRGMNEATRNLEYLIMKQSGLAMTSENREMVNDHINKATQLNALGALAYGKTGLVDAVLITKEHPSAPDEVLTRPVWDAFLKAHGMAGKTGVSKVKTFLREYDSIDQVVDWARNHQKLQPAEVALQGSIAEKPVKHWVNVFKKSVIQPALKPKVGDTAPLPENIKEAQTVKKFLKVAHKKNKKPELLSEELQLFLKEKDDTFAVSVNGLPEGSSGILNRDTLFFYNRFVSDTPDEFMPHLWALNDKKSEHAKTGPVSNLLIVENSPGGMSLVTEQIKSEIGMLDYPVDVLVSGWGSSGGSKLVSMATGNRLMMPHAEILLHETGGGASSSADELNAVVEDMNYSKNGYVDIIHKKTGRALTEVKQDFKVDFWLNSIESLMYGPQGLIDAIVIGPDLAVTRKNMVDFLTQQLGMTVAQLEKMAEERYVDIRIGEDHKPLEYHDENNPFMNPLKVLDEIAKSPFVTKMSESEQFKASVGQGSEYKTLPLEYRTVLQKEQI